MGVGGQLHAPAALPPRMIRYPLYRRLGRPQGRCGRDLNISPPSGFDPRTVQLVVNRYPTTLSHPTTPSCGEVKSEWSYTFSSYGPNQVTYPPSSADLVQHLPCNLTIEFSSVTVLTATMNMEAWCFHVHSPKHTVPLSTISYTQNDLPLKESSLSLCILDDVGSCFLS
jgi:hypothetical protein